MVNNKPEARLCALFVLLVMLHAGMAFGQAVTGTILGRVTDTTGAVVPATTVQVQNLGTGASQSVQTDAGGRYAAHNLVPGAYTVTVQQSGFQTQVQRGINVTVGSENVVNVQLSVGNVQERVEVTAEAPLVETTNATVSSLVSGAQVRDLPLNGRSIEQLALLVPGTFQNHSVANSPIQGHGVRLSVNGSRPDSNVYLLDGTVTNDHSGHGPASASGSALGVEGILEFRVISHNYSAEYGRSAGGVISAVTRSGTNQYHGSVYEFVRNNIFDARNFFNVTQAPAPSPLPALRRNQFGAAIGGPFIKDKVFFFANYEGLRERRGLSMQASVPDADFRRGLLPLASGPCTTAGGTPVGGGSCQLAVSPLIVPYLNVYPMPNGRSNGDGTALLLTDVSSRLDEDYAMERMDFRRGDNDSFYWRYVYNPSQNLYPLPIPVMNTGGRVVMHLLTLAETHIFSGSALNEIRFGANRNVPKELDSWVADIDHASLAFTPGQELGQFRLVGSTGASTSQLTDYGSARAGQFFMQNIFSVADNFSVTRGSHSLKFGVSYERIHLNTNWGRPRGEMRFAGFTDMLAAKPSVFRGLPPLSQVSVRRGLRRHYLGWFVQDDFHVSPKLTLNLGLRHEFFTSPTEVNGRIGNLINVTDAKMTPGPFFEPKIANFSPRFGLAWDPTGSGKTSVRVGTGILYNHIEARSYWRSAANNSDYQLEVTQNNPSFPRPFPANFSIGNAVFSTSSITPHPDTPIVFHYSLEVQHQVGSSLSVRAGYVGSGGYDQPRKMWANVPPPSSILPDGRKFWIAGLGQSSRPNQKFSDIERTVMDAEFNYHALQVMVQQNLSAGMRLGAAYTWSKAMSNADQLVNQQTGSTSNVAQDMDIISADYSLSAYDQRQTLVLNYSYDLPFGRFVNGGVAKAILDGWSLNGIYSYGSGLPFYFGIGFANSRNLSTEGGDRPNLNPGFSNNPTEGVTAGCAGVPAGQKLGTAERWFDPCAFSLPDAGTYGNLGRNTGKLATKNNMDFTIVKDTRITESKKLEFRAEFFNIFNRTFFAAPTAFLFTAARTHGGNEGQISATATNNREIQLGMKLIF